MEGRLTKDELIQYIHELVSYYNYEDDEIYTWIANLISDSKMFELIPLVKDLYKKGLIENMIIGKYDEFIDSMYDYSRLSKTHVIENVIDEMSNWYCFEKNENDNRTLGDKKNNGFDKMFKNFYQSTNKKVGRNEPCPCGSGMKYKHCCALKKRPFYHKYIDESISRYPKKKTNENQKDIYDFYSDDAIEIDKLMYQFLCHKAIPIFIQRNYKLEEEINVETCGKIVELLKIKLRKEHYDTIDDYDLKNSIHYSLIYFFAKYTEILVKDLKVNGYQHKLHYADKLEEILNLFYENFNLNDDNEVIFIDRTVYLYIFKDKIEEIIQYLENKLDTCSPNVKYDVYMYLFDIIGRYYNDKKKIDNYISNEKNVELRQRLKEQS